MRPRGISLLALAAVVCAPLLSLAQNSPPASNTPSNTRATTPEIYVIDVEGGNSTLIVTPSRESLLIDTGYPPPAASRDAGRIMDAVHYAGLQQIDHLLTTHWHGDHFGGLSDPHRASRSASSSITAFPIPNPPSPPQTPARPLSCETSTPSCTPRPNTPW